MCTLYCPCRAAGARSRNPLARTQKACQEKDDENHPTHMTLTAPSPDHFQNAVMMARILRSDCRVPRWKSQGLFFYRNYIRNRKPRARADPGSGMGNGIAGSQIGAKSE